MSDNRLNIISVENRPENPRRNEKRNSSRIETEAYFEREWLKNSQQFDPNRNIKERVRVERTLELIHSQGTVKGKIVADLGSGWGEFSKYLAREEGIIHAVDIATKALQRLQESSQIKTFQDYIPRTKLQDDTYDIVIGAEIIAYLPKDDYRLFISEMCRLIKSNGIVICSTSVDINSEDALQRFAELAETEFSIDQWVFSYHRLWIRIQDFFEAPRRFIKASQDAEYRTKELKIRYALCRWWFDVNSKSILPYFWRIVQVFSNPISYFISKNRSLLLGLEKICKFIWSDQGVSHAIFLGKRRPMIVTKPEDIPVIRKGKQQVWE